MDVRALLEAGLDLAAALRDAPKKDGGFSALTLAWVLHTFNVGGLARAIGWDEGQIAGLDAFRQQLIAQLTAAAKPQS